MAGGTGNGGGNGTESVDLFLQQHFEALPILLQALAWSFTTFLILLMAAVIVLIFLGANGYKYGIDLSMLISEKDGMASLSRFQFLLFTFVVAGVFAYRAFAQKQGWPTIDSNTLYLIGISGSSYVASKTVQRTTGKGEVPNKDGEKGTRFQR